MCRSPIADNPVYVMIILIIIIIIAVVSIAPYLTDKCEHTALYMLNKNVYIKPQK